MSIRNYRKAVRLAKKCEDYEAGKGVSKAYLDLVEQQLGIKLSPAHRSFFLKFGYMCFFGNEIFGLAENVPENAAPWGNMLLYTLAERKENDLPHEWLPLVFLDDGEMAYLDYSTMLGKEPRVITRIYDGTEYIHTDTEGDKPMDIGDFLLMLVKMCLSYGDW